jgi:hypothetical protein
VREDQLRSAYSRQLAERTPVSRTECASPDDLVALVERRGDEDARLRTLDHVMSCGACRPEFELLRSATRASGELAAMEMGVRSSQVRSSPRWIAPQMGLAAAAVLVIAIGTWAVVRFSGDGAGERVMRGADAVVLVEPAQNTTAASPTRFVWHRVQSASNYDFEVRSSAGDVVYATRTADTSLVLPVEMKLEPGKDYLWSVGALLEDGRQPRSAPTRFRTARR